jgi:hypothetical protein
MQNANQTSNSNLSKQKQPTIQNKPDAKRAPTVTPGNDSGKPGAPEKKDSSNKGKGPAGENL